MSPTYSSSSLGPYPARSESEPRSRSPTRVKFVEELPSPRANGSTSTSTSAFKGLFSWKRKGTSPSPDLEQADDLYASASGKSIGRPISQHRYSDGPIKSALKKSSANEVSNKSSERLRPTRPRRSPSSQQLEAIESWRRASYELAGAENISDQASSAEYSPGKGSGHDGSNAVDQAFRRPFARRTSSRPSPPIPNTTSPLSACFEGRQIWDNGKQYGSSTGHETTFDYRQDPEIEDQDVWTPRPSTPPRTSDAPRRSLPKSPLRPTISRNDFDVVSPAMSSSEAFSHCPEDEEDGPWESDTRPSGETNRRTRRQSRRCSTIANRRASALISLTSMAALNKALDSICAEVQQSSPDSEVPMFNFIPPTPVANSDDFGHRRISRAENVNASMILEDAVELKQESDSAMDVELDPTSEEEMEESRDVVPEMQTDSPTLRFGKSSNPGHRTSRSISSEQSSSSSSVSRTSMPSLSTSSSIDSIPDLDVALGMMIRSLSGGLDCSTHDVDPMQDAKDSLAEELASWASLRQREVGVAQGVGSSMAIGLGFGTGWEASPQIVITEEMANTVQPLNTRRRDDWRIRSPPSDVDKTPVPFNWSPGVDEQRSKESYQKDMGDQSRRSSAASSIMSAGPGMDTDTDSNMSDMDDLHTASIAQISHGAAACLVFASPRTVELGSTPQMSHAVHMSNHYQRQPTYEENGQDIEIGWAV